MREQSGQARRHGRDMAGELETERTTCARTDAARRGRWSARTASKRRCSARPSTATSSSASGPSSAPIDAQMLIAVVAVLTFTATQLMIPLIIRYAIDHGMAPGGDHSALRLVDRRLRDRHPHQLRRQLCAGDAWSAGVAEEVLFDIRRAMFSHLQRVSLSFMDKTEVGRLMSRLQGDVNSMQEFLETSVLSVGDIALLFGIVGVMLYLDFRLGLLTLSVLPVLFVVRLFWLPRARECLHGGARDQFDRQRRAWPKRSTACARCRAWTGRASTSRSTTTRRTPT